MQMVFGFYIFFAAVVSLVPHAASLSASVCDNIQAEWQSELPRLTGGFPFYTLLGTCVCMRYAAKQDGS